MITIIRMAGPILAWPSPSKYRYRQTEAAPTLSSIQGILAAAAGITREQVRPDWIQNIQLAIRLDKPGSVLRDFHTINPANKSIYRQLSPRDRSKVRIVAKAGGTEHTVPVITERFLTSLIPSRSPNRRMTLVCVQ